MSEKILHTHLDAKLLDIRFKSIPNTNQSTYVATFQCNGELIENINIPTFKLESAVKEYFLQTIENVGRQSLTEVLYNLNITKDGYNRIEEGEIKFYKAVEGKMYLNHISITGPQPLKKLINENVISGKWANALKVFA